jgi:hypothetical protein
MAPTHAHTVLTAIVKPKAFFLKKKSHTASFTVKEEEKASD